MFLLFDTQIDPFWLAGYIAAGLIAFAGALKAIHDIRKYGWHAFKERWITPIKARREARTVLIQTVKTVVEGQTLLSEQVTEILKEVKPNGGESLKDKVQNTNSKVENIVARLRHQDETSDVPTFHLDDKGKLIFSNCAFRELVNAEEQQLLHNDYLSLMDDEDRARFIRARGESIDFMMPIDQIVKFKLVGPHYTTVRLQASPDVRNGGVLRGFFGTACKVD